MEEFKLSEEQRKGYSEQEIKGMETLLSVLNSGIKGDINSMKSAIEEKMKGFATPEEITSMKSAIDKQADVINKLKETSGQLVDLSAKKSFLKAEFEKAYPKMLEHYKSSKEIGKGGMITAIPRSKAIDEHNPALIETTANVTRAGDPDFDWLVDSYGRREGTFRIRRPIEYIRDILNIVRVDNVPETYTWDEEGNETGAFAIVAENALKPQIFLDIVRYFTTPQKVAGYIVVTEEVLKYRSRTWAEIMILFRAKFEREYNRLLANVFATSAITYPGTALDGTFANPNDIDAVGAAALAVENLNFTPDTIIINPADKWRILLTTNQNGTYVFLPFVQNGEEPRLLGFRLITSNYVPAGTFYIGEAGTIFVQEETPSMRTGWVNDDFIHNRYTIVLENFFIAYAPQVNEGSWLMGNFDDIKDVLQL